MKLILLPVQNCNECLLENTCLLCVQNCKECLLENTCTPLFCWDLVMRDVLVYLNEIRVVTIFNHVHYICGVDS